jgi:Amidohydrolase family
LGAVAGPEGGLSPAGRQRRRLLLTLAFGGANAAILSRLPHSRRGPSPVSAARPTTTSTGAAGPPGTGYTKPDPPPEPAAVEGAQAESADHTFDLVIKGGRVVDPDSGFDSVADVGIDAGTVTLISAGDALSGTYTIDAAGQVVAPGFIDFLSYEPNEYGIWFKVADGVTTNLGMHGLNIRAADFFATYGGRSPCHFGGAFDDPFMRGELGVGADDPAPPELIAELARLAEEDIRGGYLGIDLEPEYTPGVDTAEIQALGQVGARLNVPLTFHGRFSDMSPPGTNVDTLNEILGTARATGCAVHVEHIISTGGTFSMAESLATLAAAQRDEGIDVTACMYPYDFWATYLGSHRFDDGWQERFRISYEDLEIAGTGERLTEASFQQYRAENKLAVAYAIPEEDVRTCLKAPFVLLGSDAICEPDNNNHPRAAGTFARTLGRYVRDEGVIDLMDGLAKMTILPARRLEAQAPDLRRKGRLQIGADADITIFDPATVADRSTVQQPATESAGISWVLVLGQVVKDPNGVKRDALPGQPVKADVSNRT